MLNKEQEAIGHMFDQIAGSYDSVNRILSLRQDLRWRLRVAQELPRTPGISLLDIATGTADLLITLCQRCPNISEAVGIDISENMLLVGKEKLVNSGLEGRAKLQKADAQTLPFCDSSFDVITVGFGIRNVVHIEVALNEMARVLKPGGRLLILEFSLPTNWLLRMVYLGYFRYFLPLVGGLISGNFGAYRYLNRTVEEFPSVTLFSKILASNGFKTVEAKPLSFGIATIYCARKV